MNILMFSSPYQYYADNLIPLAKFFSAKGHKVYGSYQLSVEGVEYSMLTNQAADYSKLFLAGKLNVDIVFLVQPWWYKDEAIAKYCNKKKIDFYIIDHAPPMMRYTQKDGRESHVYRANCGGAKGYFSYGNITKQIMKDVGYAGNNLVVGSSRLESVMATIKTAENKFIIFDTSNKMEDDKVVIKLIDFIQKHKDREFVLKEHSRSPKAFRKILKYKNALLGNNLTESELFRNSDFIFSFPSSAMIVPALLNKNMYSLYDHHFCSEARQYHKKYSDLIPALGDNKLGKDLSGFKKANILYMPVQTTEARIYNYILGE